VVVLNFGTAPRGMMVTGEAGGAPGMMGAGEARGGGKSTTGVAAVPTNSTGDGEAGGPPELGTPTTGENH
jgi:hypothetical protein